MRILAVGGFRVNGDSVLEFSLIKVSFLEPRQDKEDNEGVNVRDRTASKDIISRITEFKIPGEVMHLFLLNPTQRILCAYVWIPGTRTIGLYLLLDWKEENYVFVDTGIICVSAWSHTRPFC